MPEMTSPDLSPDPTPPTGPDEVDRPPGRLARLVTPRRNKLIAAGLALVLVAGVVTTMSVVNAANESAIAARLAAAEKVTAKKEAAKLVIMEAQAAKEELAAAIEDGKTTSESVEPFIAGVAAWAGPADIAELRRLRDSLTALVDTAEVDSTDGDQASGIRSASTETASKMTAIGTFEAYQDRTFLAAEEAAGYHPLDPTYTVKAARDDCAAIAKDYPNVSDAAVHFADSNDVSEKRKIVAYCPNYLPAIEQSRNYIPSDGGYTVAAAPSEWGVTPRIIAAGTYATVGTPDSCYWEVNDTHGGILRNNFIMSAPGGVSVKVAAGQGFTTQGCGEWVRR
jgi:hypothetical protein